jgi:hypothetical protein
MSGLEVRIDSSRPIFVSASADDIGAIFAKMTDADQVTVLAAMVEHMRPHRQQWDYISIALEQDGNRELRNELQDVLFPALAAKDAEIAKLREALSQCAEHIDSYYFEGDKEYQVVIIARLALEGGAR